MLVNRFSSAVELILEIIGNLLVSGSGRLVPNHLGMNKGRRMARQAKQSTPARTRKIAVGFTAINIIGNPIRSVSKRLVMVAKR